MNVDLNYSKYGYTIKVPFQLPQDEFIASKCICCGGEKAWGGLNEFIHVWNSYSGDRCRLDTMLLFVEEGDSYLDDDGYHQTHKAKETIYQCVRHPFIKLDRRSCSICWGEARDEWLAFLKEEQQGIDAAIYAKEVDPLFMTPMSGVEYMEALKQSISSSIMMSTSATGSFPFPGSVPITGPFFHHYTTGSNFYPAAITLNSESTAIITAAGPPQSSPEEKCSVDPNAIYSPFFTAEKSNTGIKSGAITMLKASQQTGSSMSKPKTKKK